MVHIVIFSDLLYKGISKRLMCKNIKYNILIYNTYLVPIFIFTRVTIPNFSKKLNKRRTHTNLIK